MTIQKALVIKSVNGNTAYRSELLIGKEAPAYSFYVCRDVVTGLPTHLHDLHETRQKLKDSFGLDLAVASKPQTTKDSDTVLPSPAVAYHEKLLGPKVCLCSCTTFI